jgi:hypothetical protein
MPLTAGSQLGSYVIIDTLGRGAMGEVFQARDLKLGRQVAIKVLLGELATDSERIARFEREARLLASLNDPNIATLYALEESEGTRFLVMELVTGQTLAQRLAAGPMGIAEALQLSGPIAAALAAAHEAGIIHRDLKPANIKVTPGGQVKVLDFGLAKAIGGEVAPLQATGSLAGTREGTILGTPLYMSPEQVRGQPLDQRTDIWSFACVLFEMLAGRSPFQGNTVADVFAAILEREPDWSILPTTTPSGIRDCLRRCLHKELGRRPRDAGDLRLLIEESATEPNSIAQIMTDAAPAATQQRESSGAVRTAVAGATEDANLTRLQKAVFVTRLKQLNKLQKSRFILEDGCLSAYVSFVIGIFVAIYVGSLVAERTKGNEATSVGIGIAAGLAATFGLARLIPTVTIRQREKAIKRKVDHILKECPREVDRWGGASMLNNAAAVEGILHLIGKGDN